MGKPNILLIFTDMQRSDTIHALGNPVIRTPALDRLVNEGTAFVSAYSPSPVCIPARCSMQYSLYPSHTGCSENLRMMDDNGRSYPAILGANGYRTHAVGKCHFTPDPFAFRGFQSRETQEEGTGNTDYHQFLRDKGYDCYEPMGQRGDMYYVPQPSHLPEAVHPTQWVGDRAVSFIEKETDEKKPWCLFASFIHPHPPFTPPRPWNKLYRGPNMPMPKITQDMESLHTSINRIQNRYKHRDQGIDNNLLRMMKAYYYATISFVDYQISRMIEALEAKGVLDDTLIFFASDHGEFLGDLNCFGKRSMHDASSRIPFLVRYPARFAPQTRSDIPVSLVDVMPTMLGAAGIGTDGLSLDGTDIAALLRDKKRDYVFSQWSCGENAQYMAVSREWKYFYSVADEKEFLFNRIADPDEMRNQAGLVSNARTKAAIKQELMTFLKTTGEERALTEDASGMQWKRFPKVDWPLQNTDFSMLFKQTELSNDPDAGLLLQDGPLADMPKSPGFDRYQ